MITVLFLLEDHKLKYQIANTVCCTCVCKFTQGRGYDSKYTKLNAEAN